MKSGLYNIANGKTRAVIAAITTMPNPYVNSGTKEGWELEKKWDAKRELALRQLTANKMLELMETL